METIWNQYISIQTQVNANKCGGVLDSRVRVAEQAARKITRQKKQRSSSRGGDPKGGGAKKDERDRRTYEAIPSN
jgi:hypothetical protein